MKTNLLISDFSSIIFDMIYQRKPIVLFIPDAYDFTIKNLYRPGYCDIINSLKNGSIVIHSFRRTFIS
jgi:CDP-glycerol glycerophosphotransferase (TagB/SpsB family)